jgi:membrane-bound lytic murein transglycosylase
VTDHETTVLSYRLQSLADDMTPPLDVVGQVRAARASHRRKRRTRIAALALATATTAVVAGTVTTTGLLTSGPGEVAGPGVPSAPVTDDAGVRDRAQRAEEAQAAQRAEAQAAAEASQAAEAEAARLAAEEAAAAEAAQRSREQATAWQSRTFEGVSFQVPAGARAADTVDRSPVTSWMEGPSLTWNGPLLGGGQPSFVRVMITATHEGGLIPTDGGEWFTVPGADKAYGGIDTTDYTGVPTGRTTVWLDILDGDRLVRVSAEFAAGPEGEQMARELIASISIG